MTARAHTMALIVAFVTQLAGWSQAQMMIPGLEGDTFALTAKAGYISTGEGNNVRFWGYADAAGAGIVQYPGPTLILQQGVPVTVTLSNELTGHSVSIVFPGQTVQASGGAAGLLTQECPPGGGPVTYSFTPTHAGTYHYHSGTRPELQVEMGLIGAIIVRPTGFDHMMPRAYAHADSAYTHEYLFLLTEMDFQVHRMAELGRVDEIGNSDYLPTYWFINGRTAMDTMLAADVSWLPNQPYNCMPMMHPGDKLLLRVISGDRDLHPFHHHGNHTRVIARNGRLLQSAPGAGADRGLEVFTIPVQPGETTDAIFEWTGEKLGWDIYGHAPGDPMEMNEYAPDHGKPFPVELPNQQDLTFGGMWSGSPFLGAMGALPPGEGGNNPMAGFSFMWHSHSEREMVNNDIFPGGMMTMLMIVPHSVPIGDGMMMMTSRRKP